MSVESVFVPVVVVVAVVAVVVTVAAIPVGSTKEALKDKEKLNVRAQNRGRQPG